MSHSCCKINKYFLLLNCLCQRTKGAEVVSQIKNIQLLPIGPALAKIPRKNIFIKMCFILPPPHSLTETVKRNFSPPPSFQITVVKQILFLLQAIPNKMRQNLTTVKSKNNKSVSRRFSWNIQLVYPSPPLPFLKKYRTRYIYLFIFTDLPLREGNIMLQNGRVSFQKIFLTY